jgi:signal transduction histidine kinase
MAQTSIDVIDERVLILAPTGKDAVLAADALRREGICPSICEDLDQLNYEVRRGAGALLLAEEALIARELPPLVETISRQPPWSDLPILIFTKSDNFQENRRLAHCFAPATNVSLLERPLSALTLTTALHAALATRRRQYQVRDLLEEQRRVADALRASQQEVLKLNAELEQRVTQRTAELRAANAELEAFCYSVSHDLRAPLRAIDGFALSVVEHCNGSLDETARHYLDRARRSVHRMQKLIDDLLSLSRLSRAQMTPQRADLSEMAWSVVRELQQNEPERKNIEFHIQPGLYAEGDPALLRIALVNLLGNAWKFTAKVPNAVVEFGVTERDGAPAFFVRDNGAGFDMTFAGKLFAPFQRLHTNHEFPGSGIGLATVQRILRRHEGDVWAEGKPRHGACVYFRLPKMSALGKQAVNGAAAA